MLFGFTFVLTQRVGVHLTLASRLARLRRLYLSKSGLTQWSRRSRFDLSLKSTTRPLATRKERDLRLNSKLSLLSCKDPVDHVWSPRPGATSIYEGWTKVSLDVSTTDNRGKRVLLCLRSRDFVNWTRSRSSPRDRTTTGSGLLWDFGTTQCTQTQKGQDSPEV